MKSSPKLKVPFDKPINLGNPLYYVKDAISDKFISGDGLYSKKCEELIEREQNLAKVMVTPSCTAALEMSALLAEVQPGDEVVLPSFTFTSTANAFVLRGAKLVFADINKTTLNAEFENYESAVSKNTKFFILVHYGGSCADLDPILQLASDLNIRVIEDAAQSYNAKYKGNSLGGFGELGCYSFHETKNIKAGEGGALVINNSDLVEMANILREKGTNRTAFMSRKVDKYQWIDVGSSFLLSDITCAYLYGQLQHADSITKKRRSAHQNYAGLLRHLEIENKIAIPKVASCIEPNGHIFSILVDKAYSRDWVIARLAELGVQATSHYEPLHSSIAGKKFGECRTSMKNSEEVGKQILRLPMFVQITSEDQEVVAHALSTVLS